MATEPAPDWAVIRRRYEETSHRVADICSDCGITRRELDNRRNREGWRRQHPRPFPGRVRRQDGGPDTANGDAAATSASPPASNTRTPRSPRPRRRTATPSQPSSDVAAPHPSPSKPGSLRGPHTPAARRRLLDRLVRAIALKLEQLERRMTDDLAAPGDATATDHERETRAIGALIDNLGKITEIETGLDRPAGARAAANDIADEADRWHRELAERLSRLVDAAGRQE